MSDVYFGNCKKLININRQKRRRRRRSVQKF
jgi:hypothetical protein